MGIIWVVLIVALTGSRLGYGLPIDSTPQVHQLDGSSSDGWLEDGRWYAVVPALALVVTAAGLLLGCAWCHRHKERKLFSQSVSQLNDGSRRSLPPDSGFSEPANNNISEDNNNGPISLREMQNIANNNATAYIVSENEERNRAVSRESVVEFEPLPAAIGAVPDPLERLADWFDLEEFPRNRLQYLREIDRGWFGRIVEGEIEEAEGSDRRTVVAKILNHNSTAEDKARFLDEAKLYRDSRHENILAFVASCLREEPWTLMFELYSMNLLQYLSVSRANMAALSESGVPLRLQCDVASALAYLHSRGYLFGNVCSSNILVRGEAESARALLGQYGDHHVPEENSESSEVVGLGVVVWETWSWRAAPHRPPLPAPEHQGLHHTHCYQLMQLCWSAAAPGGPSAAQAHRLLEHLRDHQLTADFEERWQRLKPNSIPKQASHVAQVHAARSDSLTNLHGSLDDLPRPPLDPWLEDIAAGRDDDSYYRDVSDVIKNLDNMLNSEKTSSSESSHQASPSRDALSLDCSRDAAPSGLVKSPGITDFQNILGEPVDRPLADDVDTVGTLSHSFERHSDNISQNTLENLTPDTPIKDVCDLDSQLQEVVALPPTENAKPVEEAIIDSLSEVPKSEELPRISENKEKEQANVVEMSCDIDKRTVIVDTQEPIIVEADVEVDTNIEPKPVDIVLENISEDSKIIDKNKDIHIEPMLPQASTKELIMQTQIFIQNEMNVSQSDLVRSIGIPLVEEVCLDVTTHNGTDESESQDTHESLVEEPVIESKIAVVNNVSNHIRPDLGVSEDRVIKKHFVNEEIVSRVFSPDTDYGEQQTDDEMIFEDKIVSEGEQLVDAICEPVSSRKMNELRNVDVLPDLIEDIKLPSDEYKDPCSDSLDTQSVDTQSTLPLEQPVEKVQNATTPLEEPQCTKTNEELKATPDASVLPNIDAVTSPASNNSTVYMDLINDTNTKMIKDSIDKDMKEVIKSCAELTDNSIECTIVNNESTIYMDLPNVMNETSKMLHMERVLSSKDANDVVFKDVMMSSTPKGSDSEETIEKNVKAEDLSAANGDVSSEPNTVEDGANAKNEQRDILELLSPFDSPTKSHPTDTYEENSSVVLGPFENNSLDFFRDFKSGYSEIDMPKEELLAFSSNFSEINLATPSPLRDGNFLNEVPDIEMSDEIQFFDINTVSEPKSPEKKETVELVIKQVDHTDGSSLTERPRDSPSTPPNSPGNFLASTSQKYVEEPAQLAPEQDAKEIDLSQIELQITSKLAMAENENNMNIEYSGPLTVEGIVTEDEVTLGESQWREPGPPEPEAFLAGNGGSERESFTLDEACMQALRNELEIKLPLAQVSCIEPPRAPELVVAYPGALSPIAEETHHQLSAYENDRIWNTSNRTDSSSSYLEPCNNSTDDVTELPTGLSRNDATYTLGSDPVQQTYTVQKEPASSKEPTMSADSLNASFNMVIPDSHTPSEDQSPIKDRTFTKDDKDAPSDRISQVSPFLLSPTTDTSVPESSDIVTGISTLSKTTIDAKSTKPSETQPCLSKAMSIDSWCSNDTLFNVEDNFDDLALEQDAGEFDDDDTSDTLTHHDDDKDASHCSTYILHDSRSERDSFTPDSLTAKAPAGSSEPTRDLAYGTLASSSCATDALSPRDAPWCLPPPELVRRSPLPPARLLSPPPPRDPAPPPDPAHLPPALSKMDSVDISCLADDLGADPPPADSPGADPPPADSPGYHYRNMAQSVQSTPLLDEELDADAEHIPMPLPTYNEENCLTLNIPNFEMFTNSAELRPQEISSIQNSGLFTEGESKRSVKDDRTLSYGEFESSAMCKPQEVQSRSNQDLANSTEDFHAFESSVRERPQDLSTADNANSKSECRSAKLECDQTRQSTSNVTAQSIGNYNLTNVENDSQDRSFVIESLIVETNDDQEENEQPHSIIVTETSKNCSKDSTNLTFNSHTLYPYFNTSESPKTNGVQDKASQDDSKVESLIDLTNDLVIDLDYSEPTAVTVADVSAPLSNGTAEPSDMQCNGKDENYATLSFINESFEELVESNVDESKEKLETNSEDLSSQKGNVIQELGNEERSRDVNGDCNSEETFAPIITNGDADDKKMVTEDFLRNEKNFCQLDTYLPTMLSDIRFTGPAMEVMSTSFNESPSSPPADKGWDSDSGDERDSDASSGEFIWKDGDGRETSLVPTTLYDHHREHQNGGGAETPRDGSSGSGSGSEGDEVEFVPSSWDCSAAPAKSALRSLEPVHTDGKKRVVFKRQKYHCVYEYPREVADVDCELATPADYCTYNDWATAGEEAEISYSSLYGGHPFDMAAPLRAGVTVGGDYGDDFFISSSTHPFLCLDATPTSSQFFPGLLKGGPTTPDSGVEDPPPPYAWRDPPSPSSPEALGGLRHTRDRLKLDLPPSPHAASPRHSRVFSFTLDKPRAPADAAAPPSPPPPPTFSTFGKTPPRAPDEPALLLSDGTPAETPPTPSTPATPADPADSADEDSGIESSAKNTLDRDKEL